MTQFGYCRARDCATARSRDRGSTLCCDFLYNARGKFVQGCRAQVAGGAAANGDLAATGLLVAHDQHVGDVVHLPAADLIADPLVALIEFSPYPSCRQAFAPPTTELYGNPSSRRTS